MRILFRRRYAFEVWIPFLGWRELYVWPMATHRREARDGHWIHRDRN